MMPMSLSSATTAARGSAPGHHCSYLDDGVVGVHPRQLRRCRRQRLFDRLALQPRCNAVRGEFATTPANAGSSCT